MRFSYQGELEGHPVVGEVAEGKITGNPFVAIQVEALVRGGVRVGWGPVTAPASLTDPYVARSTVAAVLDYGTASFEGDQTPVDPAPENVEEAADPNFNPRAHLRDRRGRFRDMPAGMFKPKKPKTPKLTVRKRPPRRPGAERQTKLPKPPKPELMKLPKRDDFPPVLDWVSPPPPQGQKGTRKAGGFTATGETNTKLGDLGEKIVEELAMESLLPPGKRQNPLDARYDSTSWGFEIKTVTTASQQYKVRMKKAEVESKKRYAEENNLDGGVMIVVLDAEDGKAYVYWREGIGSYELSEAKWNHMGVVVAVSFVIWTCEDDGIELGPSLEVLAAFKEMASLEPGGYEALYGVVHTDQQTVSPEYLKQVRVEAKEFLSQHGDRLSSEATATLEALGVGSSSMGMAEGGNGAVLSPTRTLRTFIDAAADDSSPAAPRIRELRLLREELVSLEGEVDRALNAIESQDDSLPAHTRRDLLLLRENADLREELVVRELATPDELDQIGMVSHETIDRCLEMGVIEEAIRRFLGGGSIGAGLSGLAARTFEAKHPRGRAGKWIESPGGSSEPATPATPKGRRKPGGPILRDRGGARGARKLAPQKRGAAGGGPRFTRYQEVENHPDVGRTIRGSKIKKVLLDDKGQERPVFETTPATSSEIQTAVESGIDHPSLSFRARSQLRERALGQKRAEGAVTQREAEQRGLAAQAQGQTFEDLRAAGYEERKRKLEARVRKAIRKGTDPEEAVSPGDFNDGERASQARLLRYAREASSTPTTAEQHAVLDEEGNYVTDDQGNVVYDVDRAQLHQAIADMFLRKRRIVDGKPQLCAECDYMEGSDDPQVLFSGGGYSSGKGGVVDRLVDEMDAENTLVLDPDMIKAYLPEFAATLQGDPEANLRVFEQSWSVAQAIQRRAQEKKLNIVVDGISDGHADEMLARVDSFREAGYESPRVVYVDIPTEEALERAAKRAKEAKKPSDRRHIPEPIMRAVHRDVASTIPGVINGAAERNLRVEVWDNDQPVPPGEKYGAPKRFANYDPAAPDADFVEDRELWDRLRDKAEEPIPDVMGELPPLPARVRTLVENAHALGIDRVPPEKNKAARDVIPAGFEDTREMYAHQDEGGQWHWSPEREAIHDRIVHELLAGHTPKDEPRIFHAYGGSATGKGTILRALGERQELPPDAVMLDPDPIKRMLPEGEPLHENPYGAHALHKESKVVLQKALAEAQRRRLNIVLDTVGGSKPPGGVAKQMEEERADGYSVEVAVVDAPLDQAIERSMERAIDEGRFVPLDVIRRNHGRSSARLQELIDLDWLPMRLIANSQRQVDIEQMTAARKGPGEELEILRPADFDRWAIKGSLAEAQ